MKINLELLKKDFPREAYSKDISRGFELTSIKAAFVTERLNDVFGLCGTGWKYSFTKFREEQGEIGVKVTLWYRKENGEWSEPISQVGGKRIVKTNVTDARKSAITDGLTKIASLLGIGHNVFKGLVKLGSPTKYPVKEYPTQAGKTVSVKPASDAQKRKIFATAKGFGVTADEIKGIVKGKYNLKSFNDLTVSQASETIEGMVDAK